MAVLNNDKEVVKNGKRVIWMRASSVKDLFDCPYRWQANNTNSGIPNIATSIRAHVGSCVHKATEIYDKKYLGGIAPATPNGDFLKRALRSFNVAFDKPEYAIREAEAKVIGDMRKVGLMLVEKYIHEVSPTLEYSHIELKCKPLEVEVGNLIFSLTGTIDRLYVERDAKSAKPTITTGIADLKTGAQAVNAQDVVEVEAHKAQLGIYEILGENTIKAPIIGVPKIIGLQTNTKARVALGNAKSARDIVLGTENEVGMLMNASKLIEHGIFFGNPSSMMCNPDYCRRYKTCRYRGADAMEISEEAEHLIEVAEEKKAMTVDLSKQSLESLLIQDAVLEDVQVDADDSIDLTKLVING